MDVKVRKIAYLSEEEQTVLVEAGKLLGSLRDGFLSGDVTELDEECKTLVEAIDAVVEEVLSK